MNSSRKNNKLTNSLPIHKYKTEIVQRLEKSNVLLVIGETGSGKTTQLPKILFESNPELNIVVTQPRRVAAISVALRVASELASKIGNTVGYAVRFEEKLSKSTRIKYVTDGMLLREAIIDNSLSKYNVIVLDEIHERSINSDILLALCKKLLSIRKDLKLVLMSATLELEKFSKYFETSSVLKIEGRTFPIEVYNTIDEEKNYVDAALITILQIHLSKEEDEFVLGDILVFLPGQEDIEDLQDLLNTKLEFVVKSSYPKYEVVTLFSAMPNQDQMKVFQPIQKGVRKIILSTNIAETSVTIPNIRYVVDCGFAKIRNYSSKNGFDSLKVHKISKNSAVQRSGRAGREAKGKCFRMYTEKFFFDLDDFNKPEIQRVNLRNVILNLKAMNIKNLHEFDFLDRPPNENFLKAYEELILIGALDSDKTSLTEEGRLMTILPLEPIFSKIVLKTLQEEYLSVREEVLTIVALLQSDNIFYTPSSQRETAEKMRKKFINPISDHLTLLNVYLQWKENKGSDRQWARDHFVNEKSLVKADDIKVQIKGYLGNIEKEAMKSGKLSAEVKNRSDFIELEQILSKEKEDVSRKQELILQCLYSGYFMNTAKYHSESIFVTLRGKTTCRVHPTSVLINDLKLAKSYEYLIYNEIIDGSKMYFKYCSLIKGEWVQRYKQYFSY